MTTLSEVAVYVLTILTYVLVFIGMNWIPAYHSNNLHLLSASSAGSNDSTQKTKK